MKLSSTNYLRYERTYPRTEQTLFILHTVAAVLFLISFIVAVVTV
jgi:hypothetical protein